MHWGRLASQDQLAGQVVYLADDSVSAIAAVDRFHV
jgi:hypothetical protein